MSMSKGMDSGKKRKYVICFIILWLLQMTAAFWFCTKKQGFHEDEFYTYYSTARTNGFYVEDGKWMERDAYRNEFVVLPGERFQYGLVKQVQSWDVHPPMYYWVFHTVASLVPGVFSKWIGLSVNLIFHGINLVLLTYLSYLVSGRDERLPLFVMFVYGFGPAAMSSVVFIRMYEMLTTFVLLCAVLHVRAVQRLQSGAAPAGESRLCVRTLLAMAAVTYVGFLTQYYYFIFLFFLAGAFCIWLLWRDGNIWNCLRYGIFQGSAFALAYLTYPAFPGQMFKGQRGAQATENFFNLSNTFERICFFWDLMNRYVFGGLLGLMLLLLAAAAVTVRMKNRGREGTTASLGAAFYMLLFATVGYFLAVSKTALLLGDTSNRYQLPVYGIATLLVFPAGKKMWEQAVRPAFRQEGRETKRASARWIRHSEPAFFAAAVCLGIVVLSYVRADVVFLYPEERVQAAWAAERAKDHTPVVYIYRPGEEWCIWDAANELFSYEEVLFVSADSVLPITDDRIENADSLAVYLAKGADPEEQLGRFPEKDGMPVQNGLQLMFTEKYCDVYYLLR